MSKVVSIDKSRSSSRGFDPRRALIAKIHVAKKELCMEDGCYRAMLERITGKTSSAAMSMGQLEAVLREFARLGFSGIKRPSKPGGLPSDEQAKKIRALWLNLYHLGELEDPAEEALLAFCNRMSGVARIEWMHAEQFDNVIRGLRGWLQRVNWHNPSAETISSIANARLRMGVDLAPATMNHAGIAAKAATIRAQYALLAIDIASFVPELMPAEDMDQLIAALGQKCRLAKGRK
jgi:phage gp16-like protein